MTRSLPQPLTDTVDDEFVLGVRPLRAGTELAVTSRYSDQTWDLTPAVLQRHAGSVPLNFRRIPPAYRATAKQLFRALLADPVPAGETQPGIGTIRGVFSRLTRFLAWLAQRETDGVPTAAPALRTLTALDLVAYDSHLGEHGMTPGSVSNARVAVGMLWRYRSLLDDALRVDPRYVPGWGRTPSPVRENRTARIPEQVLAPLLRWAMRFVDDFAPDILTAVRERHRYEALAALRAPADSEGVTTRLTTYLRAFSDLGQSLPGHQGRPNLRFIAVHLSCEPRQLRANPRWCSMIADTAAAVGLTSHTWLSTDIAGTVDEQPWLDGIALAHPTQSYETLARLLHTACYIIIAFLSGMRDSELKHLRRGAVTVQRDTRGQAYRYRLTSVVFKGEADPAGTQASWVIGAPAARAIAVLEQLQPVEQDLLFAPVLRRRGRRAEVLTTATTNLHLNELVSWINTYCTARGLADGVPLVAGTQFALRSSQFRRTLAWFIARHPGGSIAGAIQYKHHGIQMFEGYAGTSRSGFRAEVESEQALLRGEQLLALTTDYDHHALTGPAAADALRQLEQFGAAARVSGLVLTDPVRTRRFLDRNEPGLYPGTYVTCVFNPAKALCLPPRSEDQARGPALYRCQPLECGNVALTTDNATALHGELRRLATLLLQQPALPPLLHHRLRQRQNGIERLLNQTPQETS